MADGEDPVQKFRDLTGTDETNAKAYLEAANQDLEVALTHFFNEDSDNSSDSKPIEVKTRQPKPAKSRFGTVAGLNKSSSSDSEDEGEPQAFYAGGSTHSGQQVLGPRAQPTNEIVNEMFRSAKEHGAQVLNPSEAGSSKQGTFKFSGAGYRLGQTSSDSAVVVSGNGNTREPRQEMIIKLKLWRQGFSIDDGPLRKYSDPENVQFLKTVSRGEIPDELLRQAQGNEIQLSMEDHSHEEFHLTKPKLKAFSGKGNVLGSPVPGDPAPTPTPTDQRADCESRARQVIQVDSALPTTSVQIRLADGSRLVATLNHSHTIADLRTFIITARPEYAAVAFNLLTSFPSKVLTDETSTLADAQILNASLLQRLS